MLELLLINGCQPINQTVMGVHPSLLHMGLHRCRLVKVPMLTLSTAEGTYNGHVSIRAGQTHSAAG